MLIAAFDNPDEAVSNAKQLTAADIIHYAAENDSGYTPSENVTYVSVEVETVIDDNKGGTMNIGTAYKKALFLLEDIG